MAKCGAADTRGRPAVGEICPDESGSCPDGANYDAKTTVSAADISVSGPTSAIVATTSGPSAPTLGIVAGTRAVSALLLTAG